jgi:homoserine O-acetyltransferase
MKTVASLVAAMSLTVAAEAASIAGVESKLFTARDLALESGVVLPELTLAYETYGTLAPGGRNAVLITHGFTSSHHAAGTYRPGGAPKGVGEADVGSWTS